MTPTPKLATISVRTLIDSEVAYKAYLIANKTSEVWADEVEIAGKKYVVGQANSEYFVCFALPFTGHRDDWDVILPIYSARDLLSQLQGGKLQPDLHYDGPITLEYLSDLKGKIQTAIKELKNINLSDTEEWFACQEDWLDSLHRALRECSDIQVENLFEYDRKRIDITLCVLRDFEEAKSFNFNKAL